MRIRTSFLIAVMIVVVAIGLSLGHLCGCQTATTAADGTVTETRVDIDAVAQAVVLAQQVTPVIAGQLTELWAAWRVAESAKWNVDRIAEAKILLVKIRALIDIVNAVGDKDLEPMSKLTPGPADWEEPGEYGHARSRQASDGQNIEFDDDGDGYADSGTLICVYPSQNVFETSIALLEEPNMLQRSDDSIAAGPYSYHQAEAEER